MGLAKPGLVFATPAIGSGVGSSVTTTVTPGQATRVTNLLTLTIIAQGLPVVTLPVGWTRAVDASASGNTNQVWYKYNIAANEPSFDVGFSFACRNTCFLSEYNKVLSTADPLVRTWSYAALAQTLASFNTSPDSPSQLDLLVAGLFLVPVTTPTVTALARTQFFHAEQADGQTDNGAINTTQGNMAWWLGLTVGTGLRNYVQSFTSSPLGQSYDVIAALVEFAGAPGMSSDTANVAMVGQAPLVSFTGSRIPIVGSFAITGAAPIVRASIPAGQASLVLSSDAPTARQNQTITPLVGALTVAGIASVLTQPVPTARNPVAGSLALTGTASTTIITKAPVTAFLVLTGLSPPLGMNILTGAGALALAGTAAVFNRLITPNPGAFAFTDGVAPTLISGTVITPPTVDLSLTGTASTEAISITPSRATLSLAGAAPTVVINNIRTPTVGTLTLAPYAPVLKNDYRLPPVVGSLDLSGKLAVAIRGTVAAPNGAALAFSGVGAAVTNQQTLKPATGALNTAGSLQPVGRGIPPAGAVMVMAVTTPGVSQGIMVSPPTATLALSGTAPAVIRGTVLSPASVLLTLQGRRPGFSFGIIPRTGSLDATPQPRNIAVAVVAKTGAAVRMQGYAPLIGRNVPVFQLRLEER